jgi:EmrB/QacA subfamily drug resistance transporter
MKRTASPMAILAVVGFGVFIAADDLTVVSTMLRPIIGDLGIVLPDGLDDAAWIVNAYLIAYVSVMPFMGRLSDVVGRRKVYIGALTLFLIGSIMIPFTTSMGPFLVGRVLTAIGGGALVPVGMAVVGDVFEEKRRARALGTLGAIDTLGWVWGPLYGAMLVRFLSWKWQFYTNIPLAIIGIAAAWWALAAFDKPVRRSRIDWAGATALTIALVAVNLALLGSAEIQSVTGLEELTGSGGDWLRWLYLVAAGAAVAFIAIERRSEDPLIDFGLFRGRNLTAAVVINFLVGAALVIAMVDVPLFVNMVEVDVERAAVIAGWVLSALTAAMAVTSYVGGRVTERTWYQPPVLIGLAGAAAGFLLMGAGWTVDTAYWTMAWQLALLGAGFGFVIAPTSAAVVDGAPPDRRGTAASLVVVVRLIGLSVGLSGLTAWGLFRFNQFRQNVNLPPIDDPGYGEALSAAQAEVTTSALAETFLAAAVVIAIAFAVALMMRRTPPAADHDPPALAAPATADSTTLELPAQQVPPQGDRMKDFINRNIVAVLGTLGGLVVLSLLLNVVLLARASNVSADVAQNTADIERVEGGAAIFASQVTGLQTQLAELAPTVGAGLDEAIIGLEAFANSTIDFTVDINETIPINTTIDLNRTLSVPINETIPLDETINTTVSVAGPFGIDIPLDISIPVAVDVPIVLDVDIPVDEQIPITTDIPVVLSVPLSVDVAGTELARLAESLQAGLASFKAVMAGLAG